MLHRLQYISQGKSAEQHLSHIEQALDAGVKLVQLRMKDAGVKIYEETAIIAKELCGKYNAMLIVNDNAHVAEACNADVVHLGLNDMKVDEARKINGKRKIGGTANSFEHIQQRCAEEVTYIGLGPFRFTSTKKNLSPVLGINGYAELINKMKEQNLRTPVYAIGGIELHDVEQLVKAGVYGVAVSGLLTNCADKPAMVNEINKIFERC